MTDGRSQPLADKVIGSAIGGIVAAVVLWLLDGPDQWDTGEFVFHAAWWSVAPRVLLWLRSRRTRRPRHPTP